MNIKQYEYIVYIIFIYIHIYKIYEALKKASKLLETWVSHNLRSGKYFLKPGKFYLEI